MTHPFTITPYTDIHDDMILCGGLSLTHTDLTARFGLRFEEQVDDLDTFFICVIVAVGIPTFALQYRLPYADLGVSIMLPAQTYNVHRLRNPHNDRAHLLDLLRPIGALFGCNKAEDILFYETKPPAEHALMGILEDTK